MEFNVTETADWAPITVEADSPEEAAEAWMRLSKKHTTSEIADGTEFALTVMWDGGGEVCESKEIREEW